MDEGLTGGAATHEGPPPPSVVFHSQLEVGQCDCDEGRHNQEDKEHYEEDGVDRIHLQASTFVPYVQQLLLHAFTRSLNYWNKEMKQGRELALCPHTLAKM